MPIGIDSFRRLRDEHDYYTDKSMFISDWLEDGAQVTPITRPRRFGKTLNMDMVKEFLDIGGDLEPLAKDAVKQIEEKGYYTRLTGEILLMGIAHRKKECAMEVKIIKIDP